MRLLVCILLCFQGFSQTTIIPAPLKVTKQPGSLRVNIASIRQPDGKGPLIITEKGAEKLPVEGYKLVVSPANITIIGKGAGQFYGLQTLIQLLPDSAKGAVDLPCMTIEDEPRYGYRGLMLDVSRHFFTVQQIKDLLNLMAQYKLNRFHWHLTDDQGWRLEIKSLPKLTSVGGYRVKRAGDFNGNMPPPQPGEPATDGGFYTQQEVKEIVRYAAERHIRILPEIDVPGHCMAAIAAYPELSVTRNPNTRVNPGSSFAKWFPDGHFEMYEDNTLNPTDEKVYQFLDKVFTEVAALFPYEYIHIGGDECFKGYWEKDSTVQQFMRANDIANTHQLQRYFISRVNKIVRSKHKKLIGWDEILEGDLNDEVAIMNRFGEKRAIEQVGKKLKIVLAPGGQGFYFDYAQSSADLEPSSHGGNAPWWKLYNFNTTLTEEQQKYILGVEACIWTEHIPGISKLQYMMLPRLLALAETGWTAAANKSETRFTTQTLPAHLLRFDKLGINYRVPTVYKVIDTTIKADSFRLDVRPPFHGARIFYTVNNRQPGDYDHEYTAPVTIPVPAGKKVILKTIVITPAGRRSVVTRTVIDNSASTSSAP